MLRRSAFWRRVRLVAGWIAARLRAAGLPGDTERKVSLVRLVVLLALLPVFWWNVVSPETELVLIGLTVLIAGYILVTLFIIPRLRRTLRQDLLLTIDILAITALVWFTGGINSSLLFLFYLPILSAAVRLDLRESILSAVAVSGIVVWMWTMAEGGLPSLGSTTLRVGLLTGSSLFLAFFFSILAQESRLLRQRAELNRQLNEKLAEATEQLRRRLAELEFAYELSRRLAGATDTATVLMIVVEAAQRLLQAPYSAVFLVEHAGGGLVPAYTAGLDDRDAMPIMYACADRVTKDTAQPVTLQVDEAGVWTGAVCAPIIAGGRLLGVLCTGGDAQWQPARHSVAVLGHVASQAGIALDRASLMEDLQRLAVAKPEARLYSREQFDRILRDEVTRATQLAAPFAVTKLILTDIAGSEAPGDTTAGLVHKQFADLVLTTARRIDVVAEGNRGELFVLLSMTNQTGAQKFTARLLRKLQEDATLGRLLGTAGGPAVRAGIAAFPDDAVAAAELTYAAQDAAEVTSAEHPVAFASEMDSHRATASGTHHPDGLQ